MSPSLSALRKADLTLPEEDLGISHVTTVFEAKIDPVTRTCKGKEEAAIAAFGSPMSRTNRFKR
jgi:hypothetical protein